jgi:Kef-type K+ transport system membrane component KefB
MMSRGEVGLIVASVGVSNALISTELFSAIVGVVIITTLLTPPGLRQLFRKRIEGKERVLEKSETDASKAEIIEEQ